jgi:hypothetical protein
MSVTFTQEFVTIIMQAVSITILLILLYVLPAAIEIRRNYIRWLVGERAAAFSILSVIPILNLFEVGFGSMYFGMVTERKLNDLKAKAEA